MDKPVTREDVDEVLELMREFMSQVDKRFTEQESRYDRLINTIDGFLGRIDKYETELAARDSQFERLLAWARKVSEKTGIPLENL
jgi:predicted ATP-dependent protease